MNTWPGISNGQWYIWQPAIGIEPSLCKEAMMVGATIYAKCRHDGKSERDCQVEAEKTAFTYQYHIRY